MLFRPTVAVLIASLGAGLSAAEVSAADLPPVKVSERNVVPACATPGRMMGFLKSRNEKLDPRFDGIATDYMRHGEELKIRWDIAFFQMILETGNLSFGGDVKASQHNFAGLGATGNGERGESFKDVSTGVRAHLEHLLMYTGEKIANPVAERTRKVQEWGVLTEWQKTIKGPMTFAHLARKWAPPARKYAADIETVAANFMDGPCKGADPRPELVAAARKALFDEAIGTPKAAAAANTPSKPVSADAAAKPSGAELAKRAVEAARADGGGRSALGAGAVAKVAPVTEATGTKSAEKSDAVPATSFTVLNSAKPEAETALAEQPAIGEKPAAETVTKVAAAGTAKVAKPAAKPDAKEPQKCNVFTASYGGQKSVIIKAVTPDSVNYTVLDVNEGAESRETDAYIAAYAKGGKPMGEFKAQSAALDKAFELCPEG